MRVSGFRACKRARKSEYTVDPTLAVWGSCVGEEEEEEQVSPAGRV